MEDLYYFQTVEELRRNFSRRLTWSYEFRLEQLLGLERMLKNHRREFIQAVHLDTHKPHAEVTLIELIPTMGELLGGIKNLKSWMETTALPRNFLVATDVAKVRRDPLGVVLIISPWNYPLNLSLNVLWAALAAGNCVILKPSEHAPHYANLLTKLIPQYVNKECCRVITGGVPETTALLRCKFDHIFATGSTSVGKIIMTAAAKNLTPVTLELGGKCPVFIEESADFILTAERLLWGKMANAGQTCLAPDYILCSGATEPKLIEALELILAKFYPMPEPEMKINTVYKDLGRIVNITHFRRLNSALERSRGTVAVGGKRDEASLFIQPTVLVNVPPDDSLMEGELFGPILPIVRCNDVSEAINFINSRPRPLGAYIFSKTRKSIEKFEEQVLSGTMAINDVLVQGAYEGLPFGGVGESGMGQYHNKFSFDTFSHKKAIVSRRMYHWVNSVEFFRYPPYHIQWSFRKAFFSFCINNFSSFNLPSLRKIFVFFAVFFFGFFCAYLVKSL